MKAEKKGAAVGVLGATSMVGKSLLPMLAGAGWHVDAFTRQSSIAGQCADKGSGVIFHRLNGGRGDSAVFPGERAVAYWISLAPIWVLPDHFPMLEACRAKRVIALSSTSLFTKSTSSDADEQNTVKRLRQGEQNFISWAEANRIEWVIFRPNMIYGLGQDRNICEIARFISRFGFFPLLGEARGLRQPVHVMDVAAVCAAALQGGHARNRAYNISGAEKLSYREMVARVFRAMDKPEKFVNISLPVFRLAVTCLRIWPRFRNWSAAMVERMNANLVFDHADATRDLGFSPRPFQPCKTDLPISGSSNFR